MYIDRIFRILPGFDVYDVGAEVNQLFGTATTTIEDPETGKQIQNPNVQAILPQINTRTVTDPDGNVWCRASMKPDFSDALDRVMAQGYVPQTAEVLPVGAPEPTWPVPCLDENDKPITVAIKDEKGNVTGQQEQTRTKRIPMIA